MSAPAARTRAQLRISAQNAAVVAAGAVAAAAAVQVPAAPIVSAGGPSTGPDSMMLLVQLLQQQQLQAVAQQAQQALSNANAELAAAEALAQQRRASAGPSPTFEGTRSNDELAVNTWLDAMESWFALAHVDIDADAERIEIAVASLRGSAQQWWAATRAADAATVIAGGITTIDKWTNIVSLLHKHYLPQDPARWAMRQLEALKNGNNTDVQTYTNRFLQLDLMIIGQQNELSRVFAYEQGLPENYRVKSAEKQHTTLVSAIASSLALWNAKTVARAQSHNSRQSARLNNTQGDSSDDDRQTLRTPQLVTTVSATGSNSPFSAVEKLEQKLDSFIAAMQIQSGFGRGDGAKRDGGASRGRSRQQRNEGAPRSPRARTPGISEELAKQRLLARVCIKCGEPGHYARDCTNEVKSN